MKFEVDKEMVEPIIRDQIAAAVVAQMGDATNIMRKAVALALEQKVDEKGNVSQYSSHNRFSFLESLCQREIRAAASAAVQALVEEQRPKIEQAVRDHLKRAPGKTAAAIISAFCDGARHPYRLNVNFEFKPHDS